MKVTITIEVDGRTVTLSETVGADTDDTIALLMTALEVAKRQPKQPGKSRHHQVDPIAGTP